MRGRRIWLQHARQHGIVFVVYLNECLLWEASLMSESANEFSSDLNTMSGVLIVMLAKQSQPVRLRDLLIAVDIAEEVHQGDYGSVLTDVLAAADGALFSISGYALFVEPKVSPNHRGDVPMVAIALQRLEQDGLVELSNGITQFSKVSLTDQGREVARQFHEQNARKRVDGSADY